MIVYCDNCLTAVRILDEGHLTGPSSAYWPDQYNCFVCNNRCHGHKENDVPPSVLRTLHVHDMNDVEYFACLNGLGPPVERHCDATTVRDLLLNQRIVEASIDDIPGGRHCVVHKLKTEDGHILHFGASMVGAVVYRLAGNVSYAKREIENLQVEFEEKENV